MVTSALEPVPSGAILITSVSVSVTGATIGLSGTQVLLLSCSPADFPSEGLDHFQLTLASLLVSPENLLM